MIKPQVLITDTRELQRIVHDTCQTYSHEEAIALIRVQSGVSGSRKLNFVEQLMCGLLNGDVERVHDFIDEWHDAPEDLGSLHAFLGLSWEEYTAWLEGRRTIPDSVLLRKPALSVWPRPWRVWKPRQRYQKTEYDALHKGVIYERCWPNAGKLVAMDGSGKKWSTGVKFRRAANPRLSDIPPCFRHLHNRPQAKKFVPSSDKPDIPYLYDVGDRVVATQFPEDRVFVIDHRSRNRISGQPCYGGKSESTDTRMKRMTEEFLRKATPEE